jgi:hypothetical protein
MLEVSTSTTQEAPDGSLSWWTAERPTSWSSPPPDGHVLGNTNFRRRVFDPAVRVAGLEGLTPHELRHAAASLAAAGANIEAVQQMLGRFSCGLTPSRTRRTPVPRLGTGAVTCGDARAA